MKTMQIMNRLRNASRAMKPRTFVLAALTLLLVWPSGAKAGLHIDLTAGTNRFAVDRTITWNLGTTGMRGWIDYGWAETPAQDGITAFAPYQILVTAVGTNTPAVGTMAVDDVILGAIAGTGAVPLFTNDARKSLGWAIGDAEAGTGILKLKRWRSGTTTDVSITLPILGAYSATAPYNCPKTALIMTNAAASLAQRINTYGWGVDGPGSINAVALLATGITNYLPMLQTFARSLAPTNMNLEASGGITAWDCYNSIFLAEYYMLTGDAQVLHGLSEYVLYAARHTSMYGTAGHGFANVPPPEGWNLGGTHGSISWYGPVNQGGLVAQLTIALGKKAGVVDAEIDPAIARAANFFGYFVNKGSIPYGEHVPYCGEAPINGRTYWNHRSNGKDGLAAVMFAVMGGKPVQAQYYSRMALAGYNGEWNGHTGQGFSYLWTELGANVGGTNAVQGYQQKMRWDRDMKRRLDGSFVYEGGEQLGAGYNVTNYWDSNYVYHDTPTAYYLIHAAIPLKKLYITGKSADATNTLSSAVVSNALWAAQYPETCGGYTTNQLVSHLAEYDPLVWMNAATELSVRTNGAALIPTLIAMAANPTNATQRAAACYALGVMQATDAAPTLVSRLADTDYGVRFRAAEALGPWNRGWQGSGIPASASLPYLTTMMATYITNVTPTYPLSYGTNVPGFNWNDPLQQANGMLAITVFNPNNLGSYAINATKDQLWPAVKAGIKHPSGDMLGNSMSDFVTTLLTSNDVYELALDLFRMAELPPPCCAMYNESGPFMGKQVLSKYQIFEDVELCMNYTAFWGWGPAAGYDFLWPHREAARRTLPGLMDQKLAWSYTTDPVGGENFSNYTNAIAQIDGATNASPQVYGRPYAGPQIVVTPVNTAKALTLAGSSCRTSQGTYNVITQPTHGVLSGSAPNVTYTPSAGYQGMDSFTFTFTDYVTNSTPGTVQVVVGAGGIGLKGQYYDTMNFTTLMATMTNAAINFDWGTSAPASGMGVDTYSVRWTGQVLAPESGRYRFSTRTSDGVRLWVNGQLVIDDWHDQPTNLWNDSAGITLTAGSKYNVKMEYYRNTTPSTVRLYWYMPSRLECTIIPQELLYPAMDVNLTAPANGAGYASASAVTLTADVADMAGTVTNVAFYNGAALLGNDTTAPYSVVWSNVPAGEYSLTARAMNNTGLVSTSAVAVITVDGRSVPVTSGLACWYDASYGITVDRKQSVRSWLDRSTNGRNAVLHFSDGNPELMQNQLFSRPALRFNNFMTRCWLDVAGPMFVKEQYVVVRSYLSNPWNYGAFLGRSDTSASSYLLSGTGFEWLPAGVSRNGTALSSPFDLAPITNWMVLKITVDNSYTNAGPYMLGGCSGYYAAKFDVTEILGYSRALTTQEEANVGGYLAAKYGVATTYPASGSLANLPASGVTTNAAALNGLLMCNGTNYGVVAYWGTTDGGLNPANWANSAYVGSWTNVSSTNFSKQVSGLLPGATYYFTFRGTNAVSTGTIWAAPSQSFTTISTAKDILSFGANVAGSSAVIDTGAGTVAWTVPYGTAVTNLAPTYTVSPFASGSPVSGTSRNFTTPQTYTITAQNGSTKVYTVTVFFGAPSSACDILTFGPGATINGTNIAWSVPYGTALATLAPAYTVSLGASGVPASGVAPSPNFAIMNPGTYTITAQDGVTTKRYRVAITLLPYVPAGITNGSFEIGKDIPLNWNGGQGGYVGVDLSSGPSNTDLPGWSGSFNSWYDINNCDSMSAQDGVRWINLVYLDGAALCQSFAVIAGKVYTVSYYEKRRGGGGYMDTTMRVAAGTVTGTNGTPTSVDAGPAASIVQKSTTGNDEWTLHSFTFTPNTTTTATISFTNDPAGDNDGVYLDNVSVMGPPVATLINSFATGVNTNSAVLNATLGCMGTNYSVYAHWNTSYGGTNVALWTNSAYVGAWTNVASTNLSYLATGLAPGMTYYFTFRGTNASGNLWAPNVLNFTALASANQAPVITEGATAAVTMSEDGSPTPFSLTLHATDADGDTITWSVSTNAAHGTATASGTGTSKAIGYTPTANYNGADSFVVQVSDGRGGTDTITVNVTITAVNDAPSVSLTAPTNGASFTAPATITLTANASDVDGTITTVGFYNGATLLGSDTSSPYAYTWTNVAAGSYNLTARATDNGGLISTSAVVAITVTTNSLPSPWQAQDIGTVGLAGSATYSNSTYTVKGAGLGVTNTADALQFVYQASSGDCEMKLRVASLTNTTSAAKAGVMIRESLNSDAREGGVWVTPSSGIIFTRRTSTGGNTSISSSTGKTAPYWVRLTRTSNSFKAYYGTNGTSWTQLGSTATISMATNAVMGLGVCSGATNTLSTSTMDNVTATP